MKNINLTALFTLIIGISCYGQTVEKTTQTCFESIKIEPGFIAFTTHKNSQLGTWYQNSFGLKIVKEFAFPDGSVTGVLMQKDEFVVEIFFRDDVLEKKDYVPQSQSEQWKGFMKVGIYTNAELPILKQCLIDHGVKAGRIFNDEKLGVDLLYVTDPEGNAIEIISRLTK